MKIFLGITLGMVAFLAVVLLLGKAMRLSPPVRFEAKYQSEVRMESTSGREFFDASMPPELEAEIEAKIRERLPATPIEERENAPDATPTLSPDFPTRISQDYANPTMQAMIATALAEPDVQDVMIVPIAFATQTPTVGGDEK